MKTYYYSDMLNDDFSSASIKTEKVEKDFKFLNRNPIWNTAAFLAYYFIALPIVFLYDKIVFGLKIVNRRAFLKVIRKGVFVYSNHTQMLDPFLLPVAAFPKKVYPIANPDAVSIPGLRQLVLMLGCIPIPTSLAAMPEFLNAVSHRIDGANCVSIFPEAHIWPYYTKIRPFKATSFKYPVKKDVPAIAAAVTYRRRAGIAGMITKRPAITLHISDPIYPDKTLSPAKAKVELRNRAFEFMERAAASCEQQEFIRYEYAPKENAAAESEA